MKATEPVTKATPCRDLRDWLALLEQHDQLHRNREPVALRNDIAYVSQQVAARSGPAVLHEHIVDYPAWRVVHDGMTTPSRIALALGLGPDQYARHVFDVVADDRRVAPQEVASAPFQELVMTGDSVDLTALPIPTTSAYENPPYITAGISHVRTPDGQWQNIAIRRYQVQGPNTLTVLAMKAAQHEGQILGQWFARGEPAPVAIVIGADPLYYLCAQMPAPDGVSEYEYWGALAGEPLRMVRSRQFPELLLPASAEIVIEGHYHPTERLLEGPFSEFPGFHSGLFYLPRLDVTSVSLRPDAIYQYMYMGREPTEGHNLDHLVYAASMYSQLRTVVPEITDVAVLGTEGFTTAIAIRKSRNRPGLVRQLAMAVRGSRAGRLIKNLLVVDDDLNPRNLDDIVWALSVRFQGSRDLFVVDDLPGCYLDPSEQSTAGGVGQTSFTVMDLTEPLAPHNDGYKRGLAVPRCTDTATAVLRAMGLST